MLNFVVSFLCLVVVITAATMLIWVFFNTHNEKKLASFSACFASFYKDVKNFFSRRKEDADDAVSLRSSEAETKQTPPTKEPPASKPATLHQMQMNDLREQEEVVRLKASNASGLKQAADDLSDASLTEQAVVRDYLGNPQFHNDALQHRRCVKALKNADLEIAGIIAQAAETEAKALQQMAYNDAALKPQIVKAMLYARIQVAELENKLHSNPGQLTIELKRKFENFQPPASSQPAPATSATTPAVTSAPKPINGKKINGGRILSAVVVN